MEKTNKERAVDQVMDQLIPNAYAEGHSIWDKAVNGLNKMSIDELYSLHALILAKREDEPIVIQSQ